MVRVSANGPGDLGSILCQVLLKNQKWFLIPPYLTHIIIRFGWRVSGSNPWKGVAPFPTPWCSSYGKRSLRVALNYGQPAYFKFKVQISRRSLISYMYYLIPSLRIAKIILEKCFGVFWCEWNIFILVEFLKFISRYFQAFWYLYSLFSKPDSCKAIYKVWILIILTF